MSFSKFLEGLKGKARINLSDYSIGDDGSKLLAKFLKENDQIRVLELKGNNIGPDGIKDLLI